LPINKNFITSVNWKYNPKKKYLLLGEYCLLNKKKNLTKKIKIFNNKIYSEKNTNNWIKENNLLREEYLKKIRIELNRFHQVEWSLRSWRILVGPWLDKFISCINNRILLIERVLKEEKKIYHLNNSKIENLCTRDQSEFGIKILKNNYNDLLFNKIINFYQENSYIIKKKHFVKKKILKRKKIHLIYFLFNKILKIFGKIFKIKNNFVFYKIYIGNFYTTLKIFFKLKELPINYSLYDKLYDYKFPNTDFELRSKIDLEIKSKNKKILLINRLLKECMPSSYIEGFKEIFKILEKSTLPKKIKNIYTSNIFNDSLFKFWVASQVNNGSKLIHGQHGGGYDLLKDECHFNQELEICDKYLTWGWSGSNKKIIPGYLTSTISKKDFKFLNNGNITIIFDVLYFYSNTNSPLFSDEMFNSKPGYYFYSNYFISKFIEFLSAKNYNNLNLKFHPLEFKSEFSFKKYVLKNHPKLKITSNKKNLFEIFSKSKLVIFTYFHATGFYQSINLNKPCIAFTPKNNFLIKKKYHNLWKKMHKANIFHSSPEAAAKFLNKIENNIDQWWYSKKTQLVIAEFKKNHAFTDNLKLDRIEKSLKN
jgi:putative transferase (TIGR04331 family)